MKDHGESADHQIACARLVERLAKKKEIL